MWDCGRNWNGSSYHLWMDSSLLFARECFMIKNLQKRHNYGRLWYIVRFVSLLLLLCPVPL